MKTSMVIFGQLFLMFGGIHVYMESYGFGAYFLGSGICCYLSLIAAILEERKK